MKKAIACLGVVVSMHTVSAKPAVPDGLIRRIPARQPGAMTGSRFADAIERLDPVERERATLREIVDGNIPSFLRSLVPVTIAAHGGSATIFVMPDYLAVGSDEDYLRIPMNLATAETIADQFGFVLPTRKIVNAIYEQAAHHFTPQPLPAGPRMTSTEYYRKHNALIEQQVRADGVVPGTLVSGHKKDVVLTNLLTRNPGRIAIFGWHRQNGAPIQPLSTVHGACYEDYSHGIRLVSETAWHDGALRPLRDLLADATAATLVSDEGTIRMPPPVPTTFCAAAH